MTIFEKEQLIQLKTMEMNQLVNNSFANTRKQKGFFAGLAGLQTNKNNLDRVKVLRREIDELKAMKVSD